MAHDPSGVKPHSQPDPLAEILDQLKRPLVDAPFELETRRFVEQSSKALHQRLLAFADKKGIPIVLGWISEAILTAALDHPDVREKRKRGRPRSKYVRSDAQMMGALGFPEHVQAARNRIAIIEIYKAQIQNDTGEKRVSDARAIRQMILESGLYEAGTASFNAVFNSFRNLQSEARQTVKGWDS